MDNTFPLGTGSVSSNFHEYTKVRHTRIPSLLNKNKFIIRIDFNIIYVTFNIIKQQMKGGYKMEIDKIPQWILALEQEDATFLKNFVLKSGSLKEIAKIYGVTYPTVRLRLDKLIQKIEVSDQKEEEPFTTFVKGLAVDSRIDLETAKIIIEKYKSEKEK